MYSFGFVDEKYSDVSRRIVNGPIITAPGFNLRTLELTWLEADFVYIDLHGRPDQPKWLFAGDKRVIDYRQIDTFAKGKIIFATTCHLPGTALYDALRRGNVLVSGAGENFGSTGGRAIGAQLLGLWFRRMLELGMTPEKALRYAKTRVAFTSLFRRGDRDALSFQIALP